MADSTPFLSYLAVFDGSSPLGFITTSLLVVERYFTVPKLTSILLGQYLASVEGAWSSNDPQSSEILRPRFGDQIGPTRV